MTPEQNEIFVRHSAAFYEFCHHNLSPTLGTLRARYPSAALAVVCNRNGKFDSLSFASLQERKPWDGNKDSK